MSRSCLATCIVLALVGYSGCGPAKPAAPPVARVKGSVNIDGKPVPTGEIHFGMPGTAATILEIKNGTFAGETPVGNNQVEVFIYVEGPPVEKYGGTRQKQNTTLPKYWGPNTTLSAEVSAGGPNEFKFDLTSK